jgi:hypothetical protein
MYWNNNLNKMCLVLSCEVQLEGAYEMGIYNMKLSPAKTPFKC